MKIRLLGWESTGLRCPDVRVVLGTEKAVPSVSLIQMPNGTGKTTTLSLLRAALTGEARDWDADKIAQFSARDRKASTGRLVVRLTVDGAPLTFDLQLDFAEGVAHYRTTSPSAGGVVPDWHPPRHVKRFLSEKFVGLFIFDGELASRLLRAAEARAEEAIDALCQLDLVDDVAGVAEATWTRMTKEKGAKTTQGLAIWKNKEDALTRQMTKVRRGEAKYAEELEKIDAELSGIDKTIQEEISKNKGLRDEIEKLKIQEEQQTAELERSLDGVMRVVRQPHRLHPSFSDALVVLKQSLDRAKLPDATSRQFFVELAQELTCVCGRPIGDNERKTILAEAGRYLGEDISGVVNALKQDVETQVSLRDPDEVPLSALLEGLAKAEQQLLQTQTARHGLEVKAVESGSENVAALQQRYAELTRQKGERTELLDLIRQPARAGDDETTFSLASLQRQLAETQKKIAEITGTVELRRRIDIVRDLASRAKSLARDKLRDALAKDCNARLGKILVANPIKVESIQNSIVLAGQREASVGQTLAVGYTFLATVLHRGAHDFPLVVDSPAGPLDDKVRKEIGEMVPKLCEQFVAFTISTERENFLPALERVAGGNIRYLTLFRKAPGTAHLIDELPSKGVAESENGVLVEGKEYFCQFAVDQEAKE